MARFVRDLRERLAGATPRERAGLAVLGAIAAIVAALSSFDWALRSELAEQRARQRRIDIEAVFAQANDAAFQERVALDTAKVWSWSIVDSSEALGRAQAGELVQQMALLAGLANVEITDATVDEAEGALHPITVRLSADFDWASFLALTQALEQAEDSFTIVAIEVSGAASEAPRLTLTLSALFLQDTPS